MIRIYHRERQSYVDEMQYGEKQLTFLYHTVLGRILLKGIAHPLFSKLNAWYNDSERSRKKIMPFVERYQIPLGDFEQQQYSSFNDFFTRKHWAGKRPIPSNSKQLIAPADAKLLAVDITRDLKIPVKNSVYTVAGLLKDKILAEEYEQGICLIYRLTVDDCHRYCFVESGDITLKEKIDGKLHTVSSISRDYPVFVENRREYCAIDTKNMDKVVQMEVGAMLVGRIENCPVSQAVRGAEKGYFSYGGSTIIVLIKAGQVRIDDDIMNNSRDFVETKVKYGEPVGEILC